MNKSEITPEDLTPEFQNDTEKRLFSKAQDGLTADSFLTSPVGRMVIERSQAEVNEISAKLLGADMDEIKELQIKARVAIEAVNWLVNVVENGELAHQQLEAMRNE
jgi:hypothetical protein|tara:strand:- start:1313 stop:1630 length:318 start_codon:yes stop_codon:yes gene_type:complete